MTEKETILMMFDIKERVKGLESHLFENMTREEQFQTDYAEDMLAMRELQKELIVIENEMYRKNKLKLRGGFSRV